MVGSPIKRMRKAGVSDPVTGELVRFPYMPRVAELPRSWQNFGPAQKVEHSLNMSLDRAAEILSWGPVADLNAHRLHVWLQVLARRLHDRHEGPVRRRAGPRSCSRA